MAFLKNVFGPPDIGRMKAEQDVGALIDALSYRRDPTVRREAALALGQLRVQYASPALMAVMQEDLEPDVRRAAAIALGRLHPSAAFLPAMTALHDDDGGVRQAAIYLMGQIGEQKAIPYVVPFLEGGPWATRRTAAKALQRLGWQPDNSPGAAYYYIITEQWGACAALGSGAVEPLMSVLQDAQLEQHHVRAIWALGEIGDPRCVEALSQALTRRRTDIRRASAEALAAIGGGAVLEPLLSVLNDRNEAVQWAAQNGLRELQLDRVPPALDEAISAPDAATRLLAVEMVGAIDHPRAAAILAKALQDRETRVRLHATGALAQKGDMDALAQALQDEDAAVRVTAVRGLRTIDDPHTITLLAEAIEDENRSVRNEVVAALAASGGAAAVPPLCRGLHDRDPGMRRLVAETLGRLGAPEAAAALEQACGDPHPDVRQAALTALAQIGAADVTPVLLAAAGDGDAQVRETAVRLLAAVDDPEALEATIKAAGDDNPQVREEALRSLAKKGGPEAFEALVAARSDEDYRVSKTAVESLGRFGEQALPALAEALEEGGYPDQAAVRGLEQLGGIAVPVLADALNSPRLPARRAAANALMRLYLSGELSESETAIIDEQRVTLAAYAHEELLTSVEQRGER